MYIGLVSFINYIKILRKQYFFTFINHYTRYIENLTSLKNN